MNEFIQAITPALISLVTAILGYATYILGKFLKSQSEKYDIKEKFDTNKAIVDISVKYVSQVFKDAGGAEKYEQAKNKALEIMEEKGIHITDAELNMLIEASVASFNKGMNEKVVIEAPATVSPVPVEASQQTEVK